MNRLPRLGLGSLTALCSLAAVGIVLLVNGQEMFSPGPLKARSRSNVSWGGVTAHAQIGNNCAACHASPASGDTMANRCLACHTNVRDQIQQRLPLHGKLADGRNCRQCHTEHKGPDAVLTSLEHFDHDCAAFPLTGKHTTVACASCHVGNRYQGTPQSCVSCHAEPPIHKGRFGVDCARCHSTSTWSTWRSGDFANFHLATFDHDRTAFKLTGKHRTVDCKACHVNAVFKGTPSTCVSCHTEPLIHKGRYGTNCIYCHTTTRWQETSFRHRFPVNHAKALEKGSCAMCHTTTDNFQTYTCSNCHRHELTKTAQKHRKLGISDVSNCAHCHPAGRKSRLARGSGYDVLTVQHVCGACPLQLARGSDYDALTRAGSLTP